MTTTEPATEPSVAQIETITPERAVQLLENNPSNRRIRQTRVNLYAEAIRNGQWRITGETIKVGNGKLIDGQHRLWACIEAGVPFDTYIVYGVEDDAMTYIDSGLPRSMSDVIDLGGFDYTTHRAAVARLLIGWESGTMQNTNKWALTATRGAILDVVRDRHDEMGNAIRTAFNVHKYVGGQIGPIAAFLVKINEIDPAKATEFTERWVNGDMLAADDPIRALRRWVTSRTITKKRTTTTESLTAMSKAWNAFVEGGTIKKMIIKVKEPVPTLVGGSDAPVPVDVPVSDGTTVPDPYSPPA